MKLEPAFILQAIKAGDKAGDEARRDPLNGRETAIRVVLLLGNLRNTTTQ